MRTETVTASDATRASGEFMQRGIPLANEAQTALSAVAAAIGDTAGVAADFAGRTGVMRDASTTLTGEMAAVSSIVTANAAAASDMKSTTHASLSVIAPIADTALAQAETADTVCAATAQLVAQVAQVETTASDLRRQAGALNALVGAFRVADGASARPPHLAASRERPALGRLMRKGERARYAVSRSRVCALAGNARRVPCAGWRASVRETTRAREAHGA
jgi:methyl-accepting chemotaxis protein